MIKWSKQKTSWELLLLTVILWQITTCWQCCDSGPGVYLTVILWQITTCWQSCDSGPGVYLTVILWQITICWPWSNLVNIISDELLEQSRRNVQLQGITISLTWLDFGGYRSGSYLGSSTWWWSHPRRCWVIEVSMMLGGPRWLWRWVKYMYTLLFCILAGAWSIML